jgi:plastocyanin
MSRKTAFIGILGGLIASLLPIAPASAGGGACHGMEATSSRSTTIVLSDSCFMPTLARVDVGDEVRWVNKDLAVHTVTAAHNAWGSTKDLQTDDGITATFSRPGVYPYYCLYHPGMAGAVLVGDANGAGAAAGGITVAPVDDSLERTSSLMVEPEPKDSPASWPAVASVAALATGLVGFGIGRRRRKAVDPGSGSLEP